MNLTVPPQSTRFFIIIRSVLTISLPPKGDPSNRTFTLTPLPARRHRRAAVSLLVNW